MLLLPQLAVPPVITRPPQSTIVRENATLQLTCEATGQPRPTITWSRDGVQQSSPGNRFEISSIKRSQAGTYTCTADNQVKDAKTASARVTVECKSAREVQLRHSPVAGLPGASMHRATDLRCNG